MDRSLVTAGASALALAAAILAGSSATASAATAQPGIWCNAQKASLVKISDHALAVGTVGCSQGNSN